MNILICCDAKEIRTIQFGKLDDAYDQRKSKPKKEYLLKYSIDKEENSATQMEAFQQVVNCCLELVIENHHPMNMFDSLIQVKDTLGCSVDEALDQLSIDISKDGKMVSIKQLELMEDLVNGICRDLQKCGAVRMITLYSAIPENAVKRKRMIEGLFRACGYNTIAFKRLEMFNAREFGERVDRMQLLRIGQTFNRGSIRWNPDMSIHFTSGFHLLCNNGGMSTITLLSKEDSVQMTKVFFPLSLTPLHKLCINLYARDGNRGNTFIGGIQADASPYEGQKVPRIILLLKSELVEKEQVISLILFDTKNLSSRVFTIRPGNTSIASRAQWDHTEPAHQYNGKDCVFAFYKDVENIEFNRENVVFTGKEYNVLGKCVFDGVLSVDDMTKMDDGIYEASMKHLIADKLTIPEDDNKSRDYCVILSKECDNGVFMDKTASTLYVGQLVDRKPNGYGLVFDYDGTLLYSGQMKNGAYDGEGKLYHFCENVVDCYLSGTFVDNAPSGDVTIRSIYSNDIVLEGVLHSFSEGIFKGKQYYCNCLIFDGMLANWKKKSGIAYYLNGGKKYEGEFVDGMASGRGKHFFYNSTESNNPLAYRTRNNLPPLPPSRVEYEGEYVNGLCEGSGTLYANCEESRIVYLGDFKKNVFDGEGVLCIHPMWKISTFETYSNTALSHRLVRTWPYDPTHSIIYYKGRFKDGYASREGFVVFTNQTYCKFVEKNGLMQTTGIWDYKQNCLYGVMHLARDWSLVYDSVSSECINGKWYSGSWDSGRKCLCNPILEISGDKQIKGTFEIVSDESSFLKHHYKLLATIGKVGFIILYSFRFESNP